MKLSVYALKPNMIILTLTVLFTLTAHSSAALESFEKWSCESPDSGVSHSIELTLGDGILSSFEYTSSTPSPDGDTHFICSFSATSEDRDKKWIIQKDRIVVNFEDARENDDHAIMQRTNDSFIFYFKMSPSNCGHSTPFATKISISKDKKSCHGIRVE